MCMPVSVLSVTIVRLMKKGQGSVNLWPTHRCQVSADVAQVLLCGFLDGNKLRQLTTQRCHLQTRRDQLHMRGRSEYTGSALHLPTALVCYLYWQGGELGVQGEAYRDRKEDRLSIWDKIQHKALANKALANTVCTGVKAWVGGWVGGELALWLVCLQQSHMKQAVT